MLMSFVQNNSILALNMMIGMSYMPGLGLGRLKQGPHEFTFTFDHDIPYGLGYTPIEDDARHMTRLRRDRVRTRLSGFHLIIPSAHIPFSRLTTSLEDQSIHPT